MSGRFCGSSLTLGSVALTGTGTYCNVFVAKINNCKSEEEEEEEEQQQQQQQQQQ